MEIERLRALLELGWLSLNRNDYENALSCAQQGLGMDPDDPEVLLLAGLAALRVPDPGVAEYATRYLLELRPNDSRSHLLLGFFSHEVKKDAVGAERAFREAIRLDPEEPENYAFLGQFLATRERNREGIATARKGLKLDPENYLVLHALQMLYRRAEEKELSEEFGKRALEVAPEESANFLEAGFRLLEGRKDTEAKGKFLEALRLDPGDGTTFEAIAHEKVRQHPFFRKGLYLPLNRTTLVGAVLTPVVWWGLSLLWRPIIWMAIVSAVIVIGLYAYTGAFYLCRRIIVRQLRSGKL